MKNLFEPLKRLFFYARKVQQGSATRKMSLHFYTRERCNNFFVSLRFSRVSLHTQNQQTINNNRKEKDFIITNATSATTATTNSRNTCGLGEIGDFYKSIRIIGKVRCFRCIVALTKKTASKARMECEGTRCRDSIQSRDRVGIGDADAGGLGGNLKATRRKQR